MTVAFIRPMRFTVSPSSPMPVAGSVAFLDNDQPGLGWRSGLASHLIIDLGPNPKPYGYVALFGANLRSSDTVRVRTGTTSTGVGSFDVSRAAFTGFKDEDDRDVTTKVIVRFANPTSERFMRIDLTAPGHPNGFIQFSRLIVGSAIEAEGIEIGAEQTFETQSIVERGAGYRTVDDYGSFDGWKIGTPWIEANEWRQKWSPMLRYMARGGGVLFIADITTPETWQTDSLFGFSETLATGKWDSATHLRFETKLIAYGQ